jgi:AraC-like DNA-binding protein
VHAQIVDAPDPLVSAAVRGLMPWRERDVTAMSEALFISETQLRRRCRAAVGLAPKALHRMLRFQGFLALVQQAIAAGRTPTDDGLASLALRAGYADQPHLTRECVRLTGVPPRAFLAETQRACACGHDHAASFAPVLRGSPATRNATFVSQERTFVASLEARAATPLSRRYCGY